MPIFKDFSENGELLQVRLEPLNKQNLSRYIKVNGFENAQGYLDGLDDMLNAIHESLTSQGRGRAYDNSPAVVRTRVRKLRTEKLNLVRFGQKHLEYASASNGSNNPDNAFSENATDTQNSNEQLENRNFEEYVTGNGIGQARGYIEAVHDITSATSRILEYDLGNVIMPNTPSFVRKEMRKLLEERSAFWEFGDKFIHESASQNASEALKFIK